ncbi:MAG: chlororespiratory reduction protein 7 [Synechococcus sp. MED-G71]|jgi:hypothetical protein|nr:MAG: chlororespiratory reduction protein 7 [Synechococcus sp. MED-G71]|tara:strand:- start:8303 stop:8557 length:255 start_codon:yes stop_codon:yes gene_type:complete
MSDPLIRALDHYVVLDPTVGEQILSAADTRRWLAEQLQRLECLPSDLAAQGSEQQQVEWLLDTACALELEPGLTVQWFAVRLEP